MGIATARSMAEKGASVIITGRDETRGASAAEEIRAGWTRCASRLHRRGFLRRCPRWGARRSTRQARSTSWSTVPACPPWERYSADTDEAAVSTSLFRINVEGAPFFLVPPRARPEDRRPRRLDIDHQRLQRWSRATASQAWPPTAPRARRSSCSPRRRPPNTGRRTYPGLNAVAPGPTLTPTLEPRLALATSSPSKIPLRRVAAVHELSRTLSRSSRNSGWLGYIER